jgi:hypothetical protein
LFDKADQSIDVDGLGEEIHGSQVQGTTAVLHAPLTRDDQSARRFPTQEELLKDV